MNPAAGLAVALVAALVLWLPSLSACLRGDTDLLTAALRYVAAFVAARLGVGIIGHLYEAYATDAARRARTAPPAPPPAVSAGASEGDERAADSPA